MKLVFQRVEYCVSRFSLQFREGMIDFVRDWFLAHGLYIVFYIFYCQSRQIAQVRIFTL